jgi:acyl carrier protein
MNRTTILETIQSTLIEILDNDSLRISEQTRADDVADWDSLNHVRLLISLEPTFNIRFEPEETADAKNVGELIDLILKKLR